MYCKTLPLNRRFLLFIPLFLLGFVYGQRPLIKSQYDKAQLQQVFLLQLDEGQDSGLANNPNLDLLKEKQGVQSVEYRPFDRTFVIKTDLKFPKKDILHFFRALGLDPKWEK